MRNVREKEGFGTDIKMILLLALPTIIEQALQTIVQYADTAMVGRLGADASAAVGLTTSVTWLVNAPMFAAGIGVLACMARFWGSKDGPSVTKTGGQALFLVLIVGVAEGFVFTAASSHIPAWLGAEEHIRPAAAAYFTIISLPMLFRASNIILSSALRAVKDMKTPMKVNLLVNGMNIVLNYFLIYETRQIFIGSRAVTVVGAGLGVAGAAAATALSQTLGGILMFIAFMRNTRLNMCSEKLRFDKDIMTRCVVIGIPVALERMCVCLGHVTFTGLVTKLGTVAFASHSIALTAEQAFYIPGYGMQAAASTLVGNAIGERDAHKLKKVSGQLMQLAFWLMTATGLLLFSFPRWLMGLFTPDAAVIEGGIIILRLVALSEPIFGVVIMLEGIFNGAGDTRMPFVISLVSMWGVRIASTWLCVNVFHLGLTAVWLCMIADNVCRFILLTIKYKRWKIYKALEN